MTQYMERVYQQKLKLEAEQWANTPKSLHSHQLKSMWYCLLYTSDAADE